MFYLLLLYNQSITRLYVWDPKIPGIVKKIYLKYLYKFETLVPFEVLPLRFAGGS